MATQEPVVSIVLPTFNRADYLTNAISSVLRQRTQYTYEILVVDDNSSDQTADIVSRIGDERITFIGLKTRHGGGGARNVGISAARGRYIAFIDSDVTWHPEKLERQVSILESDPEIAGVYSKYVKIGPGDKKKILPGNLFNANIHQELLKENFIDTPTAIVRKSAIDRIGGFDTKLPRFQDWELFLRLSIDNTFHGIDEPLIESLDLPDSISRNDLARKDALEIIFQKHEGLFKKDLKALFRISAKIIYSKITLGLNQEARSFFSHVQQDLPPLRRIALYALTYAPPGMADRIRHLKRKIM